MNPFLIAFLALVGASVVMYLGETIGEVKKAKYGSVAVEDIPIALETGNYVLHEIAKDGLPPRDENDESLFIGRVAFIFDGCVVSGWPLDDGNWEADSDVGRHGPFGGVTHWIEFDTEVWNMGKE
jgi:hypothetical protein